MRVKREGKQVSNKESPWRIQDDAEGQKEQAESAVSQWILQMAASPPSVWIRVGPFSHTLSLLEIIKLSNVWTYC